MKTAGTIKAPTVLTLNEANIQNNFESTISQADLLAGKKTKETRPDNQQSINRCAELLENLLTDVQTVDFDSIINPTNNPDKKVTVGEKYVVVIEKLIEIAEKRRWGVCKNSAFVYLYNGAFWQELDRDILKQFLGRAAYLMGLPEYHTKQTDNAEKILKQFDYTGFQPQPESKRILINLQNGTLEIDDNGQHKLRDFERSDFLKYQLPFEFNPQATAPMFQNFLDKVLPDITAQNVLAEYCGYCFIKNDFLKLEKALILYGQGANGKSVFFDVITAMFGSENVSGYNISSLCNENGYYTAMLQNKLVNYSSEIGNSRQFNADTFKQLCSGEKIQARLPYGKPFVISNYARLIFNANTLPKDTEQTNAYFRRFLIIPFEVTIPPERQDKELAKRIIETELAGVLNWVLTGLDRVISNRNFSKCEASEKALENYQRDSNSVLAFLLDKGYIKSLNNYKTLQELYTGIDSYTQYCNESGLRACSLREFSKRLQTASFEVVKDRHKANGGRIVYIEIENENEIDTNFKNETDYDKLLF
jgi:putative DNA primase/helicase